MDSHNFSSSPDPLNQKLYLNKPMRKSTQIVGRTTLPKAVGSAWHLMPSGFRSSPAVTPRAPPSACYPEHRALPRLISSNPNNNPKSRCVMCPSLHVCRPDRSPYCPGGGGLQSLLPLAVKPCPSFAIPEEGLTQRWWCDRPR